ncbi:sulfatase-like protein [Streptomyces sp. Ag109_G2-6]|nr:sulfatase-like protein [Streptomyces sp. Ag109_G2-6]
MEIGQDVPTLAEVPHDAGYATYAVGTWHLTRDSASNAADDRRSPGRCTSATGASATPAACDP